jgi:hypothetical protein
VVYPLKVGPTNRYLVDQNDVPFMIVGDSPQSLIGNLSVAQADTYFADRQARGFNAVWINIICTTYTFCNADGTTFDGIPPFTTPGDLSTPNEAYFARADAMIQLAANHGITVFLDPIETGGLLSMLINNGPAKDFNYGVYLGNRYKDFPNIVWMSGNDFKAWTDPTSDSDAQAVARGIRSVDPNHIQTVELNNNLSGSLDDPTWAPLIDLDAAYTYFPTYAQVLVEYNRSNFMPVFMVEANYEFEHNVNDRGTPNILRRQEYWTMLSGATGQLYGSHWTVTFNSAWQNHLGTPGAVQIGFMKSLFESRPWYNLVPDQNHTLVTSGIGTFSTTSALGSNDYLTAASTPDGSLALAYMPTSRTITVAMSRLNGPVFARWFNPSNGTYSAVSGSPFPNSGTQPFTPPGENNDGDSDWVLVLETNP